MGAALAAFAYDFLATPRIVERPIAEAVTHPDPGAVNGATDDSRDAAAVK